jgi:hypothetical protein
MNVIIINLSVYICINKHYSMYISYRIALLMFNINLSLIISSYTKIYEH